MKALPAGSLPAFPSGSAFTFGGMAYEIGPDGATFSPPLSLVFTLSQAQWGQDYTVKSFDHKTGTWVRSAHDVGCGHGNRYGRGLPPLLFCPVSPARLPHPHTPVVTSLPVPAAPQVKAQPPTTAVSIFANMIGWAAGLVMNNIIILVVAIILGNRSLPGNEGRAPGSG